MPKCRNCRRKLTGHNSHGCYICPNNHVQCIKCNKHNCRQCVRCGKLTAFLRDYYGTQGSEKPKFCALESIPESSKELLCVQNSGSEGLEERTDTDTESTTTSELDQTSEIDQTSNIDQTPDIEDNNLKGFNENPQDGADAPMQSLNYGNEKITFPLEFNHLLTSLSEVMNVNNVSAENDGLKSSDIEDNNLKGFNENPQDGADAPMQSLNYGNEKTFPLEFNHLLTSLSEVMNVNVSAENEGLKSSPTKANNDINVKRQDSKASQTKPNDKPQTYPVRTFFTKVGVSNEYMLEVCKPTDEEEKPCAKVVLGQNEKDSLMEALDAKCDQNPTSASANDRQDQIPQAPPNTPVSSSIQRSDGTIDRCTITWELRNGIIVSKECKNETVYRVVDGRAVPRQKHVPKEIMTERKAAVAGVDASKTCKDSAKRDHAVKDVAHKPKRSDRKGKSVGVKSSRSLLIMPSAYTNCQLQRCHLQSAGEPPVHRPILTERMMLPLTMMTGKYFGNEDDDLPMPLTRSKLFVRASTFLCPICLETQATAKFTAHIVNVHYNHGSEIVMAGDRINFKVYTRIASETGALIHKTFILRRKVSEGVYANVTPILIMSSRLNMDELSGSFSLTPPWCEYDKYRGEERITSPDLDPLVIWAAGLDTAALHGVKVTLAVGNKILQLSATNSLLPITRSLKAANVYFSGDYHLILMSSEMGQLSGRRGGIRVQMMVH